MFETKEYTCPICKKSYKDVIKGHIPGKLCRDCTIKAVADRQIMLKSDQERIAKLIAEEVSLEQTDTQIAEQIAAIAKKQDASTEKAQLRKLMADLELNKTRENAILAEIAKLKRKKN